LSSSVDASTKGAGKICCCVADVLFGDTVMERAKCSSFARQPGKCCLGNSIVAVVNDGCKGGYSNQCQNSEHYYHDDEFQESETSALFADFLVAGFGNLLCQGETALGLGVHGAPSK
jgi:hypothetical protein